MLRLLLDEGLSPSISPRLWAEGIDNYPLRDRGLLGLADHDVWRLANEQGRTVVTINGVDFRRLAKRTENHAGLVIIPSGGTREDHYRRVMHSIDHARFETMLLRNTIMEISANGDIAVESTARR